jgi:predicted glycogen debranching enzyme
MLMNSTIEWLEADGLGGFASGTSTGVRSRRYHGLLLVATTPPTGRVMLVNGIEAWVETRAGRFALTTQSYAPDVRYPDGARRIGGFANDPWPHWTFRLEDGTVVESEIYVPKGRAACVLRWRAAAVTGDEALLSVRPLMSGRHYHATHRENAAFRFEPDRSDESLTWRPYDGVPPVIVRTNGSYEHDPTWYRDFLYEEERLRGLDCVEDLASPGVLRFDLAKQPAVLILSSHVPGIPPLAGGASERQAERLAEAERRRRRFPSVLHRAADAYLVSRGAGQTLVAGYPWFTDWGRDTFIALRGLCIAGDRLPDALEILLAWAGTVSEGMLPNRFPDVAGEPEFNAVDASLWYVIAVHDFLEAAGRRELPVDGQAREALRTAVDAILSGYASGTRYGIRMDQDGLLAAGVPGLQLTWMDAKVGDWVVTPRIGKPVEVEALWLNALWAASRWSPGWTSLLTRGLETFRRRFRDEITGGLVDVVDPFHVQGTSDPTFRPNQIFAVGGLPLMLLDPTEARRVVDAVEARLVTPYGLRSLAPGSPGYAPRYEGNGAERDARYHQGTVWPWLIGPFVEAWVRVRGATEGVKQEARGRFLTPLLELAGRSAGHLPEIADADSPHTSGLSGPGLVGRRSPSSRGRCPGAGCGELPGPAP